MGFFDWLTAAAPVPAKPRRHKAGHVDGVHYSGHVPELDRLRRAGEFGAYEVLLWRCIEATEAEARAQRCGVAPAYYERLAILFRKQGRQTDEISVLERYQCQRKAPGVGPSKLRERLRKLKTQD